MASAFNSGEPAVVIPMHDEQIAKLDGSQIAGHSTQSLQPLEHWDPVPLPGANPAIAATLRMGWGETYDSSAVAVLEAPTFEVLFEKICANPSTPDAHGPYICAPMTHGLRKAENAESTRILMLDFDELTAEEGTRLEQGIDELKVSAITWTTRKSTPEKPRIRVMVELSAPVTKDEYAVVHARFVSEVRSKAACEIKVDSTSAQPFQPQLVPLATSAIKKFFGADRVPFDVAAATEAKQSITALPAGSNLPLAQGIGALPNDPLVAAALKKGLCPKLVKPGTIGVTCPWAHEHTGESSKSSSAVLLPHYEGREGYGYKCLHAHCAGRGIKEFRKYVRISQSGSKALKFSLTPIPEKWLAESLPPKEFVLEGWIPRGTVGLLVAEGGTGKTMLTIRAAMAVAGGRDLFGIPTRHGKAVLLALEDPEDVLRRRVKGIYDAEAIEFISPMSAAHLFSADYAMYGKNLVERLICKSLVGSELHLVQTGAEGAEQSDQVGGLIAMLKDIGHVELLVLDPLSRLHGLEENDSSVGTALINAAERIAQEVGCAVLITHHTGKGNSRERLTDAYSARGSSALADAARTVLRLITAEAGSDGKYSNISTEDIENGRILNLVHAKSNYGPRVPTLWLKKADTGITRFEPTPTNAFHAMWEKFMTWWIENMSPKPVFKNGLIDRRTEIWGIATTKQQVATFIQRGIDDSKLKPAGSGGAKNPSSQALLPVIAG
jgi:regulatory protein RepA